MASFAAIDRNGNSLDIDSARVDALKLALRGIGNSDTRLR